MGQHPRPLSRLFSLTTVEFSGIRTRIVGEPPSLRYCTMIVSALRDGSLDANLFFENLARHKIRLGYPI